jgi:hypothetical protein
MTSLSAFNAVSRFGATPARVQWTVVRGDTAQVRIQFFEPDEETAFDTTTWTYIATAYNPVSKISNILLCTPGVGFVDITASPAITETWGAGYKSTVMELPFDLEVTITEEGDDTVWTPVIGTISVLADISIGGS